MRSGRSTGSRSSIPSSSRRLSWTRKRACGRMRFCWPRRHSRSIRSFSTSCCGWRTSPTAACNFSFCARWGRRSRRVAIAAQDRLLARHIEDPWMQIAALSGLFGTRAPACSSPRRAFTNQETEARATLFPAGGVGDRAPAANRRRCVTCWRPSRARPHPSPKWWRMASLQGLGGAEAARSRRPAAAEAAAAAGITLLARTWDRTCW